MVIFAGEKFRNKFVVKTFHVGVIFTIPLIFSLKNHMGLFSRGGNFREEGNILKNTKITPHENFHVYSIQ